jgi:hypothetical protein
MQRARPFFVVSELAGPAPGYDRYEINVAVNAVVRPQGVVTGASDLPA